MYQGGLVSTTGVEGGGGGGGGWFLAKYLVLDPTELPSNEGQGSSVVGRRWTLGTVTELDVTVGSSGAGQFQKGDRPKSINKSPRQKKWRKMILIEIKRNVDEKLTHLYHPPLFLSLW